MNVIAVNVGNSRISCARFLGGVMLEPAHHETSDAQAAGQALARQADGDLVALCSVVPSASAEVKAILKEREIRILEVRSGSDAIISGTYSTMGADRIASAAAGWQLYALGSPVIVIDLGTATTLTAVDGEGRFSGGLITLGLGSTFQALHKDAAQLPAITLSGERPHPSPLAFDTESAIVSGTILAHVGMVEHWIALSRRRLGPKAVVVGTGGWAQTLAGYTRAFDHTDPHLTLKGIYLIAAAAEDRGDRG